MKRILPLSIFVRILLATLLPLILIFSLVIVIITRNVFQASTEAAQEQTLAFARQSAEQIRDSIISASRLMKVAAKGLAFAAGDSDSAREAALEFMEDIFRNTPNAYRLRMYFEPEEDAFGAGESFGRVFYHENGAVVRYLFTLDHEPGLDLSLPQYALPLKEGVPYHDSAVPRPFGLNAGPEYTAGTNYPVLRNGKVIGCVGMALLYRRSSPNIDQWEADGSHRLLIISEQGTVLYAPDDSLIERNVDSLGFDPALLENIKDALQRDASFMGEGYSPVFGKESLVCLYPVGLPEPSARVFVYMDTPTELVYGGALAAVRTVLLTFLIGLLIFVCSLFVATRNIVKPIKKLTANANLIANGHLDAVLDEFDGSGEVRDEVSSLEHSLKKMLKKLLSNQNLKITAMKSEHEKMELEEAAAVKNRFFANMSHEIRTPMNVVLGMSEILLAENLTNDQKKFVQDIKFASEGLLDIINDILDLSRLESGKLSLLPAHYDFRILMENICSMSKYLAEKKGLDFRVETGGDIPDYLYGDEGRLRQVLLNLIGNAVKFTEKGVIALSITDRGETLRFDIVDTGIGMRPEDLQYIFEPFKQIDGPKNRSVKGTGLGLSISRNLVALMGGAITIDSEYGKGSSFHVTIPRMPGEGGKIAKKAESLPLSFDSGSRVLVVDDSEGNLKVATEFLKMFGIVADTASSGEEALAMASNSDYDLVFMDHMMPGMDGVETTRRIRALGDRQARMPVVALTANAVIGSREFLLESGIDDFLAKPIEKVKFQAMLAKWLPENLMMRENNYALSSRFAFHSAQVAKSSDGTGETEKRKSTGSRTTRILVRVSEVKDLDVPLGLERMAGNRNLYKDLLGLMVETIPATLVKIDAALSEGDAVSLTIAIHTLKGALANLGVVELAEGAAELERVGNLGDFRLFAERLGPFRRDLEAFARNLREQLSSEGDGGELGMPAEGLLLADALRELRDALTGFDYGKSMEIIAGLTQFDWGEAHNSAIKAVHTHTRHFDYDAALDELRRNFPEMG